MLPNVFLWKIHYMVSITSIVEVDVDFKSLIYSDYKKFID
jgi:hypothetical protein